MPAAEINRRQFRMTRAAMDRATVKTQRESKKIEIVVARIAAIVSLGEISIFIWFRVRDGRPDAHRAGCNRRPNATQVPSNLN